MVWRRNLEMICTRILNSLLWITTIRAICMAWKNIGKPIYPRFYCTVVFNPLEQLVFNPLEQLVFKQFSLLIAIHIHTYDHNISCYLLISSCKSSLYPLKWRIHSRGDKILRQKNYCLYCFGSSPQTIITYGTYVLFIFMVLTGRFTITAIRETKKILCINILNWIGCSKKNIKVWKISAPKKECSERRHKQCLNSTRVLMASTILKGNSL